MRRTTKQLALGWLLLGVVAGSGQGTKTKENKDAPRVLMALPFGVEPGKSTKVILRGLKIEGVKEVKLPARVAHTIVRKGKANVPNQQEASVVGDSEVEIELKLPQDYPGEAVEAVVVTAAGTSAPHRILIDRTALVAEKEPNDGFAQAQEVSLGQTIDGTISRAQDVDVYRFTASAGDRVELEVLGRRHGSGLDSFLVLYDGLGRVVAMSDDHAETTDSRIAATLKQGGSFYLSVTDAHDQGGATHRYRLQLRKAITK